MRKPIWKFSNTLTRTSHTKEYCVFITKIDDSKTYQKHRPAVILGYPDTTFTPVIMMLIAVDATGANALACTLNWAIF